MIKTNIKSIPYWKCDALIDGEPGVVIVTRQSHESIFIPKDIKYDVVLTSVPDKQLFLWQNTGEDIMDGARDNRSVVLLGMEEITPADEYSGLDDFKQDF